MNYIFGFPGAALVTDRSGKTSISAGVPIDDFTVLELAMAAGLVADEDSFFASSIELSTPTFTLAPALVVDDDAIAAVTVLYLPILRPAPVAVDDAFSVPTIVALPGPSRTLGPPQVTAPDVFYSLFVTNVGLGGGPQQKLRPPPKIQDNDIIYAPSTSKHTGLVLDTEAINTPVVLARADLGFALVTEADVIHAPGVINAYTMQALRVLDPDTVYSTLITQVLEPALLASDDDIPAADVGWHLFSDGEYLDEDTIFPVHAQALNELLPELWFDEETIDTYPFFVQSVEGGIPQKPREGVLKGSIKQPPKLIGSITTKRAA